MIYLTPSDFTGRFRLSGDPSIQSQQYQAIREAEAELLGLLFGSEVASYLAAGGYDPVFGNLLRRGFPYFVLPYPVYAVPFVFHRYADLVLGHNRSEPPKLEWEGRGSVYQVGRVIAYMGMNWAGRQLGVIDGFSPDRYYHDATQLRYTALGYNFFVPPPFVGARMLVGGQEARVVAVNALPNDEFEVILDNTFPINTPVFCREYPKPKMPL